MGSSRSLIKAILFAAFIAGTLDLLTAYLFNHYIISHISFTQLLQSIASGVFGKEAFTGGNQVAVYGLIFHYLITLSFTTIFFLICRLMPSVLENKVLTGVLYGIIVWIIMNLLILPVSRFQARPLQWDIALVNMIILILCIGLPVSFFAYRYYSMRLETNR